MASDDMKSYFSQFVVALKNVHKNGMAFPRANGTMSYSQSQRMQFGGATSPSWSQRLTNTIIARLSTLMEDEEARFARDATRPDPVPAALLASPDALRRVLGRRAANLGNQQEARASWGGGYIDDMILTMLGPIRMVAMLNNLWKVCEDWRIPVAKGKAVCGQRVTVIGYEFRTRTLRFKLTDNKVHLLRSWFRRLREQRGSGEGGDRGVGDVGAVAEANGCEGRAVGGEGGDRGVGDVDAVEVNGGEGRAVGGESDDCGIGDVGAPGEVNLDQAGAVGCEAIDRGVGTSHGSFVGSSPSATSWTRGSRGRGEGNPRRCGARGGWQGHLRSGDAEIPSGRAPSYLFARGAIGGELRHLSRFVLESLNGAITQPWPFISAPRSESRPRCPPGARAVHRHQVTQRKSRN